MAQVRNTKNVVTRNMDKVVEETRNENDIRTAVGSQFLKTKVGSVPLENTQIREPTILSGEKESKQIKRKSTYEIVVLSIFFLIFVLASICFLFNKYYFKRNLNLALPTPTVSNQLTPTPINENVLLRPTPNPTEKIVVPPTGQQCLKYPTLIAQGLIKILVVPVYFSDVRDEVITHGKRVGVYFDAFNEINIYLSKIQQDKGGKKILDLDFELSKPIVVTQQPAYFELKATNIKTEIKSQLPEIDLKDYQIIIFRALTNISTNTNGYNMGDVIWINRNWTSDAPIPEKVEYIENNNQYALHLYRGILTSLILHEILHTFGMSDGEGARVNVFFTGGIYDGTQTLFHKDLGSDLRDVDVDTGIFQDIGLNVSREIGWSDINNNGILDVEEFCKK